MGTTKTETNGQILGTDDKATFYPALGTESDVSDEKDIRGETTLEEIADNPRIGVLWYIVYTLKMTSILYITKALY